MAQYHRCQSFTGAEAIGQHWQFASRLIHVADSGRINFSCEFATQTLHHQITTLY